ncbi:metallophosphoesterase [Shimia ponticola]|uniref:metallophosphoesterase n=1 Tax=Shimia ponticola TaxID=2582893 RepID=UPI0011BFCFF5|nr:metallophosphoesterase [Shimia ponticola]
MKLIVLSDLHLMQDDPVRDQGNHARLYSAVERINTAYPDADLVVVAGDIADRGKLLRPYQDAYAALSCLIPPWTVTVGNHDDRETFKSVFGVGHCDPNGFVQSSHDLDGTRVIVLDSASEEPAPEGMRGARDPAGQLCPARLTWLDHQLASAKGMPVLIVFHHPAIPTCITLDDWILRSPEALIDRLVAHGQVRHVISGHIHMTTTSFFRGIPFTTIAGGHTTSVEDFGGRENKFRRTGPAQMAVVLSDADKTIVHFDNYVDANPDFQK